jgi:tubulin--tyrosine ligase
MIGQTLTASYFRPGTILKDDGIIQDYPFDDGKEEWVLIDGTPASCAQIGLHHLFKDKGPIDLLLSGPNYGRNTTALFSLSSGTIGAALEGAVNGFKSIALSYAFDSREHNPDIIAAASRVSTRLLEKIMSEWPEDVHLYSINVPLRPNVETTRILYTDMIQNKWSGSSFTEMSGSASDQDPGKEEQRIRDGRTNSESAKTAERRQRVTWKWSPSFADVRKGVEDAGKGDGWTVMQGEISVTPLRANFWPLPHYSGEIKL